MRVLVAPDSFKGSVTAPAAAAIAAGWRRERPQDDLVEMPQADGGEGTLAAIERSIPGATLHRAGLVTGPAGTPVAGEWLQLPDGTVVIEVAQMSGITLMPELYPLGATSHGLGQVIAAALDAGAKRLVIGLGGSASTDGGRAALAAIGNRVPPPGGAVLLSDVRNPLLGTLGAAYTFGPQKGATDEDVRALERRLTEVADTIGEDPATPGAGAAGGAAYGLSAWGASIEAGAESIARITGLTEAAASADLIISGEGQFDAQSLFGKVVGAALRLPPPLALIAGVINHPFDGWSVSLTDLAGTPERAMLAPETWLERAGALAARTHSLSNSTSASVEGATQ